MPNYSSPPSDATELNGVRLSRDFLSERLGLGAVEEADLLHFLHCRSGSHCHLSFWRVVKDVNRRIRLDGPIVRILEALDLAPNAVLFLLLPQGRGFDFKSDIRGFGRRFQCGCGARVLVWGQRGSSGRHVAVTGVLRVPSLVPGC